MSPTHLMNRNSLLLLHPSLYSLALLAACASPPPREAMEPAGLGPVLPVAEAKPAGASSIAAATLAQADHAPKRAELNAGLGITDSPVSTLFAASYDIPLHSSITFGPALHVGYGEDVELLGGEAKGKFYFAPFHESVQAFVSAGGGFGMVDKARVDEDWGLLFSVGCGLRVKTSTHGVLSSELNLYMLPEELAGEETYYGWQVVQFAIAF